MTNIDARRQQLIAQVAAGFQPDYLFFWSHRPKPGGVTKSCLSQWHEGSPFTVDGVTYRSAEHFMMAHKARVFGDKDVEARIIATMATTSPRDVKALGRSIKGFDKKVWDEEGFSGVVQGNIAKFSQNLDLRDFLMGTIGRTLVEASPDDNIWGVGLAEQDARVLNPTQWLGPNQLGFAIMDARDTIALRLSQAYDSPSP